MDSLPEQSLLTKQILTTDDRERLLSEIEILRSCVYAKNDTAFKNALKNDIRQRIAEIISAEIADKNPLDYLDSIEKEFEGLEEVKLEIAFEAAQGSINRIYEYLVKLIGKRIIIDLSVNKYILGGAVIIFRGRYLDLSMRKIFDVEIKEARENLLKMLSRTEEVKR